MQVLQRLDGLYIKATYLPDQAESSVSNVTMEVAVPYGDPSLDPVATSVEECACPSSYTGKQRAAEAPQSTPNTILVWGPLVELLSNLVEGNVFRRLFINGGNLFVDIMCTKRY